MKSPHKDTYYHWCEFSVVNSGCCHDDDKEDEGSPAANKDTPGDSEFIELRFALSAFPPTGDSGSSPSGFGYFGSWSGSVFLLDSLY